jgi:hypothetical protein
MSLSSKSSRLALTVIVLTLTMAGLRCLVFQWTKTGGKRSSLSSPRNVNYPVVLGNEEVNQLYGGIESLPTTLLIGRDGRTSFFSFRTHWQRRVSKRDSSIARRETR